ncbi:hypothetical protein Leryth_016071 [Lithospermum erythrorhizon]|nr:hypothetical protein Leryth_016071 [Lithospermum erythrorhizon]
MIERHKEAVPLRFHSGYLSSYLDPRNSAYILGVLENFLDIYQKLQTMLSCQLPYALSQHQVANKSRMQQSWFAELSSLKMVTTPEHKDAPEQVHTDIIFTKNEQDKISLTDDAHYWAPDENLI